MGVDVIDLLGSDPGVVKRGAHGAGTACAVRQWRNRMIGIIRGAEAENFGVDARASVQGVFEILEHQHRGPLAEYESSP